MLRTNGQQLAVKCLLNVHDKELRKQLRAELKFMEVARCFFSFEEQGAGNQDGGVGRGFGKSLRGC
jgi:hypothetical protein